MTIIANKLRVRALLLFLTLCVITARGEVVAHFPMELNQGELTETVSAKSFPVEGVHAAESIVGAEGGALRLDGYSSYVAAAIDASRLSRSALSVTMWCAMESYPMMNNDGAVNTSTFLAGNMNDTTKEGFAFLLSSQGDYSFECFVEGWKVTCRANEKLEKYRWNHLAAVVDMAQKSVRLFCNAREVGFAQIKINGEIKPGTDAFMIGKAFDDVKSGPFLLNTVNGLIDDIRLYDVPLSLNELTNVTPDRPADFSISASRFADDVLRPRFHSMPAANWTNEPHGLIRYNGRYHLFFQKNPNGPYWGRLHWGHISSDNLIQWQEERVAIAPSVGYDWKGCWSGCVFADEYLTGGKPHLYYTAVDNAKASIAEAYPMDDELIHWEKDVRNPIVPARPAGLSDDFRDPYIFMHNGSYYMIVGTGKEGVGAATLHRYDKSARTWSNDGSIFFRGRNASIAGTFWEMPVIVPMTDNRWLFVVTPLGSRQGVEVLYWVGTLAADATFVPLPAFVNEPKEMEIGSLGREGYGLLSPSLCQMDEGKYVAIGIVPDKLRAEANHSLGWAHTFSLPRELTLDDNNMLVQQPYSGLKEMRTSTAFAAADFDLSGTRDLTPVSGRSYECEAEFTVGTASKVGFRLFKEGNSAVEVSYQPSSNKLVVDARGVERLRNDEGSFNGLYESVLPARVIQGSQLSMRIFVDHSILDIFINNRWASSIRLFPTASSAVGLEAFSEGASTSFSSLRAWVLDPLNSGQSDAEHPNTTVPMRFTSDVHTLHYYNLPSDTLLSVYDLYGNLRVQCSPSAPNGSIYVPLDGLHLVEAKSASMHYCQKLLFRTH